MSILVPFLLLQAAAAAPAPPEMAAGLPDDAKIVCRTVTATGSRLGGKRVCMSKKEWRRMDRESEETTRSFQDRNSKQGDNN